MNNKNLWKTYSDEDIRELNLLANEYKEFLSKGKTERICVGLSIDEARKKGFRELDEIKNSGKPIKAGDKFYVSFMGKALILGIMGEEKLEKGMNILGAHIDSPRIDVKQNPLYESRDLAYLDTHYYGGIKKYQWVTIPLAIYGVVAKKDGSLINIAIGDKEGDPVFCITDLLIHISAKQLEKKASVVIEGEQLDLLIGGIPMKDKEKDAVKSNVLDILLREYNIEEEDFMSAELEIVPAGKARDLGFDRSMILGYGQDDRICAFTSLKAILGLEDIPNRTSLCILVDKEEIGSMGASGMQSRFFENTVAEIIDLAEENYSDLKLRKAITNSYMLSSDVSAGIDPNFEEVFESKNAAFLGHGVVFNKFTGSRGKFGSNDANPEYIAKIRKILDDNEVVFQTAEMGKVDEGGGGTIAYIMGNYGMNVIDSGVALLSMHAPFEVSSKADTLEAYRCYKVFLKEMK